MGLFCFPYSFLLTVLNKFCFLLFQQHCQKLIAWDSPWSGPRPWSPRHHRTSPRWSFTFSSCPGLISGPRALVWDLNLEPRNMAGGFESGQRLQLKKQISTMSIEKGRKIQIWTNEPGSLRHFHLVQNARLDCCPEFAGNLLWISFLVLHSVLKFVLRNYESTFYIYVVILYLCRHFL